MREALTRALAGRAALLFPRSAADVVAARAAHDGSGMVLLVIESDIPDVDRAMVLAAVGPLATDMAPDVRIAALDLGVGAAVDDVVASGVFLATAESTTGQIVRLSPR